MKNNKILLMIMSIGIIITGLTLWILFSSKKQVVSNPSGIVSFEEIVVAAGNTYADPKFLNPVEYLPITELPATVAEQFKKIDLGYKYLFIQKMGSENDISWSVKAMMDDKNYCTFSFLPDGKIIQIRSFIDDETENAGRIFLEGNTYEILPDQIPERVLNRLPHFGFEEVPSRAYFVKALGGQRVFVQLGNRDSRMILSFTENGEIRSAGSAGSMLRAYIPRRIETIEEIQGNLSKYGDKYYVKTVLEKIENVSIDINEGFRFVVLGDNRSNLRVWNAVVQSINQWNPLFAINLGDLTLNGYSWDMDGSLLQTLEKYAKYPFLAVAGNHDVRSGGLPYEYIFGGKDSRVFHFDVGNCRFIILDNTDDKSAIPWKDQLQMADKWLEVDTQYKFVFAHTPIYEVEKWAFHSMTEEMSSPFAKLMSKHSVDHVFFGHIHAYSTATYEGVEYTITGGAGAGLHRRFGKLGSVNHYMVVDILPESIEMRVVQLIPQNN